MLSGGTVDEYRGSLCGQGLARGIHHKAGDLLMSKVSLDLSEATVAESKEDSDRRRAQRAALIVRVDYSTIDEIFSEFTSDINEGGLFIETEKPRPPGTEVSLYFNLPGSDGTVKTNGTVIRVCDGSDGSTPGMGIEFEELPPDARAHIDQVIRSLRCRPS